MAQKRETVFRRRVREFLKTLTNTVAFPIQQISIRGTADFLLCSQGLFVSLELKDALGSYSSSRALQEFNESEVRRCGGVTIVAAPENWEEVKKQLRKLDQGDQND